MITPFNAAYPDIVVDVIVDDKLSDIVTGRFDAGIRLLMLRAVLDGVGIGYLFYHHVGEHLAGPTRQYA